jgi:hypothetical protein
VKKETIQNIDFWMNRFLAIPVQIVPPPMYIAS